MRMIRGAHAREEGRGTGGTLRRALSALGAGALVAVVLWTGSSAAQAADTPTTLDGVEFQNTTFRDQSTQVLNITWHATESPAEPVVRVEFDLPEGLRGVADSFDIGNGTCTVTESHVSCVVDDDYVLANPLNVRGEFSIRVQVDLRNEETVPGATFQVGNVTTPPVEVTSRYCTVNCEFGGQGTGKWGGYSNATDDITWTVSVPTSGAGVASEDGGRSLAAGQTVTVTDDYDASNPFTLVGGPTVQRASCLTTNQWNEETLTGWTTVDPADYTVSDEGRVVEFVTVAGTGCPGEGEALTGSVYRVQWVVHAEDGGKGVTGPGQYRNEATIEIGGIARETAGNATRFTNSGSAIGENHSRFRLSKVFDADSGVLLPDEIQVGYVIRYPDGVPADSTGTITLDAANGWSYQSGDIYAGSVITLTEVDPWPLNVISTAALTGSGATTNPDGSFTFTAVGATQLDYTLTNQASLDTQTLSAQKVVENPDGVALPEDAEFTVTATWPENAELAIAAGSTSVVLPADGEVVAFDGLPVGADVTFTEETPDAVAGATWTASSVTPETLTIGDASEDVTVTATNVLSRDVGTFTIEKELTGSAAGLVTDLTFEVDYSYPANPGLGIEAGGGSVEVVAGGEPATVTAPAGAEITLGESPVEVEGGTWAQPEFTPGSTFTVVQDQNVTIGLTNLITLDTGDFSVHKVLEGNAADRVPDDTGFTVLYSYPAGTGFAAGSGELTVTAGETVTSPQLPYGAEVTLSEVAPTAVEGAAWSAPEFSTTTVRIGDGTTAAVTLTNTLTDPSLSSTDLAGTGGEPDPWIITAALLLVAAGVLAIAVAARRRARQDTTDTVEAP